MTVQEIAIADVQENVDKPVETDAVTRVVIMDVPVVVDVHVLADVKVVVLGHVRKCVLMIVLFIVNMDVENNARMDAAMLVVVIVLDIAKSLVLRDVIELVQTDVNHLVELHVRVIAQMVVVVTVDLGVKEVRDCFNSFI